MNHSADKPAHSESGFMSQTESEIRQIMLIDDDEMILKVMEQCLKDLPNVKLHTAMDCANGRRILQINPEIALVICDQLLPDGEGVEFLRDMRTQYPSAVRVLITGVHDHEVSLKAINRGEIYRYIEKPFTRDYLVGTVLQSLDRFNLQAENDRLQAQLAIQNEELRKANAELARRVEEEKQRAVGLEQESSDWKQACQNMVDLTLEILQRIDLNLFKHSQRVARLATAVAHEMGKDQEFIDKLEIAALLHDLGLLGTNPALQNQQRQLDLITDFSERDMVRSHSEVSASLVKFLPQHDVVQAIEQHHEYLDGSGYPKGLRGHHISQLAMILAVTDSFDEMVCSRDFALQQIEIQAGSMYDAEVVRALSRLIQQHNFRPSVERPMLINELLPGMKIVTSIYTTSGMLLVKKDQILTDAVIRKLQQHSAANTVSQTIFVETQE